MRGNCKFCNTPLDAKEDTRGMDFEPINHGRHIVEFLVREGVKSVDICNYCYAHVSLFKHDRPAEYARLASQKPI